MKSSTVKVISLCVVSMFIAACDRTSWVEFDGGGCSAQEIQDITGDSFAMMLAGQMAKATCEAHGKGTFAGKFRCDGEKVMAACKN